MSAWKIAVRELYKNGGIANLRRLQMSLGGTDISDGSLRVAIRLGLVVLNGKHSVKGQRPHSLFSLTTKGKLWCQGKLIDGRGIGTARNHKAIGFIATWLMALPEDIHFGQSFEQRACASCQSRMVLFYPDEPTTATCSPCVAASKRINDFMPHTSAAMLFQHKTVNQQH